MRSRTAPAIATTSPASWPKGESTRPARCRACPRPRSRASFKALRQADENAEKDLSERVLVHKRLAKVVVRTGRLEISLSLPNDAEPKRLDLPWSAPASRRKREIVGLPAAASERRPMRAEARARLLEALAKARLWLDGLIVGRFTS